LHLRFASNVLTLLHSVRHDQPGVRTVVVLTPGDLIKRVRYLLSVL